MHIRLVTACLLFASCGSSDGASKADAGRQIDGGQAQCDNRPDPVTIPEQQGLAFVAHYHSEDVQLVRTDGAMLRAQAPLMTGHVNRALVVDRSNQILAVVSDINEGSGYNVDFFRYELPTDPGIDVPMPTLLHSLIITEGKPVTGVFDEKTRRLFLQVASLDPDVRSSQLITYDMSDPQSPVEIGRATMPVTTYMALDPARDLLFFLKSIQLREKSVELYVYDVSKDSAVPLDESPMDLTPLYPPNLDDNNGFSAGRPVVDSERSRLLVARTEGVSSELMVLDYPDAIPSTTCETYQDLASLSSITKIDDAFDTSLPYDERPNLLYAHRPDVNPTTGQVFVSGRAWSGTPPPSGIVFGMDADYQLAPGCESDNAEGFGCFLRPYSDGEPVGYRITDGALCVDWAHQVVLGTVVAPSETSPGAVHGFHFDDDLKLTPWLTEDNSTLLVGALPLDSVCL